MTADGTLYIDEVCRDTFEKELNDWFGKDNWSLNGNSFGDCWDMSEFPNKTNVDVLDYERDEVIGKVEITSKSYIEDMGAGEYINKEPVNIKLLWIKDELTQLIKEKIKSINDNSTI